MKSGLVRVFQGIYLESLRPAAYRFELAARRPEWVQALRLRRLLKFSANTAFGRQWNFQHIRSIADYQKALPIVEYADLEPWIARIEQGESGVLTADPVCMMERTSGSTGKDRLFPYTQGLLEELSRATHPWLFDLYKRRPQLRGCVAYWSVSPVTRQGERTHGGIPIGFEDDTAYFNPAVAWALRHTLAVPPRVARLSSWEEWRRQTAIHLLEASKLGLISVWSPTFLTLLLRYVERNLETLLPVLAPARAREVRVALERAGTFSPQAIWPRLALVSCWCDGASRHFLPELRHFLPQVEIQPKGLLATEGVVSIPMGLEAHAALAVAGHFLEFIDLNAPTRRPVLAHALEVGGSYSPVLSTRGGLYRYHLKDVVQCVGHYRATPTIRFEGRLEGSSDLAGEKLTSRRVDQAILRVEEETGVRWRFVMLVPLAGPTPGYALLTESDDHDRVLLDAAARLEADLQGSHHYRYCRALGQLRELRVFRVRDAMHIYQETLMRSGARMGNIKPRSLDSRTDWLEAFADCAVECRTPQEDGRRSGRSPSPGTLPGD